MKVDESASLPGQTLARVATLINSSSFGQTLKQIAGVKNNPNENKYSFRPIVFL